MTSWNDVSQAVPDLAERVQRCFDSHTHKTIATLRRDGAPRISGIEVEFRNGEVTLGMMPASLKAQDVRRDNRVAFHSASPDPDDRDDAGEWPGDAKIAGRAVQLTDPATFGYSPEDVPPEGALFFRIDVTEIVHNRLGGDPPDHMVIDFWTPGAGRRQVKRT